MNFDQTLQRHGRGIELSKNIKILVTFDLHSRSRDPRWPPNTFFKVKFGPKTTHNSVKFNNFCFVLLLEISSPLWMEKQYQQWFHVSFGSRETTLLYYSSLLWKIALLTGSRHFQLRMMGKLIQTVTVPPLISLQ